MCVSVSHFPDNKISLSYILKLSPLFHVPSDDKVISDQGHKFVNGVNKHLFALTKTQHRVSTAYHPQTNGLVERFNQTLQRPLLKLVGKEQDYWDDFLDSVLFAYRTCKQKLTKVTPYELMYCRYEIQSIIHLVSHCVPFRNFLLPTHHLVQE